MAKQLGKFSDEAFDQSIVNEWQQLQETTSKEDLKNMPIDTLTTLAKQLPINELMQQGLQTLYDVKGWTAEDLMQLHGVGYVSATDIRDAAAQIISSVEKHASPRINPDNLSDEDISLLKTIYYKWSCADAAETLQEDILHLLEEVQPFIFEVQHRKGWFGSLFQFERTKQQIQNAFDALNDPKVQSTYKKMQDTYKDILQVQITSEELKRHFIKENVSYYTEIEKVTGVAASEEAEGLPSEIVEEVQNESLNVTGLRLTLRHYQEFGAKYALHFKRTLLGDEMGLGKTIQALAMINHLRHDGKAYCLVVCPLSVVANWKNELEKFSDIPVSIFHGTKRWRALQNWNENAGIMITTYEHTVHLEADNLEKLNTCVVDEAHYVKNPDAKRSKNVYRIVTSAEYVLFMSGTPLENRLEEMKQLIHVLQPSIAETLTENLHLLKPAEFKREVSEVYLRRNREAVLNELPELNIIPQWTEFGEEEAAFYQGAVEAGMLMKMRQAAWQGRAPSKSPKLDKLLSLCDEAKENGHKVLVFSFFRDIIATIQKHLGNKSLEAITGDVPNQRRQEIINEFEEAEAGYVLPSQITAGGVGLNIQAANIVILCEPQWKPSTEEQAISRSYRMGQSRNVTVYRLLTEDSIDSVMLSVLGDKAELFNLYARESEVGEAAMTKHEEKTLKDQVLQLEKERLGA